MTLKIASITPYNVRCGIATYSKKLNNALAQQDVDVYVVRLSRFGRKTPMLLENMVNTIPVDKIDIIHCFPQGTPILTIKGLKTSLKKIEDVADEDCLYTHKGVVGMINQKFSRRYDGKLVCITAKYNDPIKCTPEHPFLIVKKPWKDNHTTRLFHKRTRKRVDMPDLKPQWIPASDIKVGDYVILPRFKQLGQVDRISVDYAGLPSRNYKIFDTFIASKARKNLVRVADKTIPITNAICRLIGLYIAEGSSNGSQVRFSFNSKETDLADDVKNTMMFMGCQNKASVSYAGNSMTVTFSSLPIANLLTSLCGKGALNKRLPTWWLGLNDECLAEMIKGIWLGDCIQNDGFSISSHSHTLREQLRLAYNRLGIVASVYPTSIRVCGAGIKKLEILWHVKHPAESKHNFRDFAEINDDFIAYRICAKTEEDYHGDVFNFEVDPDNSYLVLGYAVHNCQHEYGLFQMLEQPFYDALKALGKPVVTTAHAVGVRMGIDAVFAMGSDRVIVHNQFCADKLGYTEKTVVIPHGASVCENTEMVKAKKSWGIDSRIPIVGYCGFISEYKGLEILIEAVREIPSVALLIAGGYHTQNDTPYISMLKRRTLEVLRNRCHWTGYVADERLPDAYGAMDMLCYPSHFATESGALLMALSHGKAMIASSIPPFLEKEKLGALTTFKDVADLTRKIKRLLKDEELRKRLEEGGRNYVKSVDWQKIAEKHIALYRQVLNA